MQAEDVALALGKAFPLRWTMQRKYHLPARTPGEPYYLCFEPGGGIFGERWNQFDTAGVLHKGSYNPVSIAQYALYCHEKAYAGDAAARTAFFRQVEFLRSAQRPDGSFPYDVGHSAFSLAPGWISAMSQGEAASVFLRAFSMDGDEAYLSCAAAALRPLERSTEDGGATFMHRNGVFFEEVAGLPTHILNGHLCAAFAVWEACEYGFASPELRRLHEAAVETLARWLPLYDDGGWSFYDLGRRRNVKRYYVPITYHQTHIVQLKVYAAMTGRREFADMAERWEHGMAEWSVRARVLRDAAERLANRALRSVRNAPAGPWYVKHGTPGNAT